MRIFELLGAKVHLSTRWRVLILLLAFPLAGAATPCLYRGLDADARVINRSGEISTPFPNSLSSQDCNRLRVASGAVAVYVDRGGSALANWQVNRGTLVPASAGQGDSAAGGATNILAQIKIVLEGVNRFKNGSSRGTDGEHLVASLPIGRLAQPNVDLIIGLGPVPDQNLESFELLANGKVVSRQIGPLQFIQLPAALLTAGSQLTWRLNYSGSKHEGSFQVETAEIVDDLKQTLTKNVQGDSDALMVQLRVASGLNLEGYSWDARQLIRTALVR